MEHGVRHTLRYFLRFGYPPTVEELHTYHPQLRISKKQLQTQLDFMLKKGQVKKIELPDGLIRYTLGEYSITANNLQKAQAISQYKRKKLSTYLPVLGIIPWIRFAGLSGSMAMGHAKEEDDIDIFIVAVHNRLWLARLCALGAAAALGLRRRRGRHVDPDKICLNLFFDEGSLTVPVFKQTEYVAHEVLQMKPLLDKDGVYSRFLKKNAWTGRFFPNAARNSAKKPSFIPRSRQSAYIGDLIERIVCILQLWAVDRHRTTEIISGDQLWFFPDDFERKIGVK
jgi:hypothetical protein